jgi:PAS domain S-box-containing protein
MLNTPENTPVLNPVVSKRSKTVVTDDTVHQLAFENTAQANIITTPGNGKIIIVNNAACKLLGYSKKELLTKSRADIFDINESGFKKMLKERTADGQSITLVTAFKKEGKPFPCEITSAVFTCKDGIEKAITSIADISPSILKQKMIDTKNEKIVSDNIDLAKSEQIKIDIQNEKIVSDNIDLAKSEQIKIDIRNKKIVSDNIDLAKSEQKKIDIQNEKIVADNIVQAKYDQKKIDIQNEKIVADNIVQAKYDQKEIDTKNEKIVADNIVQAKSDQKEIDTRKEKIVADNILLAQEKSDARQEENSKQNRELEDKLVQEIKLKEKQIVEATEDAKETERADIGKELHDNINQLLAASRLYQEMAKGGGKDSDIYLSRSSDYTLTAIEAISKLTKALTTDIIKDLGLCDAIEQLTRDTIKEKQLKISCTLDSFIEGSVNDKFKLNVYRIIQEQLHNILKHAGATEINISLLQNKRSIMLSISDNGIGFDTEKKQMGIGIANIKSRAMSYNGMAEFVSQPDLGCILTARFPLTDTLLNDDK